jgi:hypothetical protein
MVNQPCLRGLLQGFEGTAPELRQLIERADVEISQRHLARHRPVAPADQPRIRDRMVGGATRARRHQRGAAAGEAGDTMDACGLNGFGQGHRRQDGGQSPGQHRLASPRRAEQEDVGITTPAYHFASPMSLRMPMDPLLNRLVKRPHQDEALS